MLLVWREREGKKVGRERGRGEEGGSDRGRREERSREGRTVREKPRGVGDDAVCCCQRQESNSTPITSGCGSDLFPPLENGAKDSSCLVDWGEDAEGLVPGRSSHCAGCMLFEI